MFLKKNVLSSSIALALIGLGAPAFANDGAIQEVVVEGGLRASLKANMEIKRDSVGVVDAITAEDMGKFPDTNLAESLQRITGVSISRSNGEGSQVTVRGFGPEYNLVTLNGRQLPTHNGTNRSFDFADLASEGISAVEVYKTGQANVPTGGIGSSINIVTSRPLENPGFKSSVGVKLVADSSVTIGDEELTPEFSGIFSNTFLNDTVGVSLSGVAQNRKGGQASATVGGWNTGPADSSEWTRRIGDAGHLNIENLPEGTLLSKPQSMAYSLSNFESDRVNGMLNVQWAPTETVTATVDYVYSSMIVESRYNDLASWFNGGNRDRTSSWNSVIDGNSTPLFYSEEEKGTTDYTNGVGYNKDRNKANSAGLNIEWQAMDNLVLEFDYHDSTAKRASMDPRSGSITMASFNRRETTGHFGGEMAILELDLGTLEDGSARPLMKEDMIITGSQFGSGESDMQIEAARFAGTFDFSDSTTIDFGVELNEISNRSVGALVESGTWGGITDITGDLVDVLDRRSIVSQFDQIANFDDSRQQVEFFTTNLEDLIVIAEENIASGRYTPNPNQQGTFGNCGTAYCDIQGGKLDVNGEMVNWDSDLQTTEETKVAYFQINHATEFNAMPANLRVGLRYEDTEVSSAGIVPRYEGVSWTNAANEFMISATEPQNVDDVGAYDLLLPNLDFDISVTDDMVLRASVSKTVTRPNYAQIKGGTTLGGLSFKGLQNSGGTEASGGNPGLEPIESTNFDLSAEWYYGEESYVSVGYFKKDVKNFIAAGEERQSERWNLPHPALGDFWLQAVADAAVDGATSNAEVFDWIRDNRAPSPEWSLNGDQVTINGVDGDPLVPVDVKTDVNMNDARVDGWEFAIQHNFADTGYGMIVNYTMANANISYDNTFTSGAQFVINGLSDSANFIAFYDQDGLQARVAYNWRDDFLAGIGQAQGTFTNPTNVRAYGQWDFNVSYEYDDNFTVFVEGLNVTESIPRNYGRIDSQVLGVYQGGARYNFGARFKF
jgi:TonB-dependent receptor